MLPGSTLTWLSCPSPGHPERGEPGPLAGAQSRPGPVGEAGGHLATPPRLMAGGLGWGSVLRGGRALGAPGRALKQRKPPSECQFGSWGTLSPLNPPVGLGLGLEAPGSWGPSPAECLQGAGGEAPEGGPAEPYPDS